MNKRILFLLWLPVLGIFGISAAAPNGYYDDAHGKKGAALLSSLCDIISTHTTVSYSGLWNMYKKTDVDASGKIWDMYSTKRWNPGKEQCGQYSSVGDCYNREHSFPKSWFNDASPMVSDGFHIYPTDGKVNGQRSNYPFGECANGTTLPSHGGVRALGKLGKSTFSGYSGTVFEPDDEYKGDFARSYFYMAACYNNRISSWSSPMLAGNKYPAFSSWAINLLLKWNREDPVSEKETKRNDAVYGYQHNRNPFIDHPELAEYIWGTMKDTGWTEGGSVTAPAWTKPVDGSTLDMGPTTLNTEVSKTINVQGTNFTTTATVSVTGAGFSALASSLNADAINRGTTLTIAYRPTSSNATSGTLTLKSGDAVTTVNLRGSVVSGIPANDATDITFDSFTASWVNIGDASTVYTLHVTQNGQEIAGYPRAMAPGATSYIVGDLEAGATYVYWLTGMGLESNHVSVTTHDDLPELIVEPEQDLVFRSTPGVPSRAITITVNTYRISDDILVSVNKGFEVSTDRTNWNTMLIMPDDTDHFYLRANQSAVGTFYTPVTVESGDFINDDLSAMAVITERPTGFFESFEAQQSAGYTSENLQMDAANWSMESAGAFEDSRISHSGSQGIRFNRDAGGYIVMTSDKAGGIGTVTFCTRLFDQESATIVAEYSLDGGATWTTLATVKPSADWTETSVKVDRSGDKVRLRFTKTDGARVALDDINVTDSGDAGIEAVETEAPLNWEAYCLNGQLAVEALTTTPVDAAVYSLDGAEHWRGRVAATVSLPLGAGVYIVVVGDDSRRVVVR